MPFGRQVGLAGQPSPALAQTQSSITPTSAEPSLDRALAMLTPDEAQDVRGWDARQKFLFLAGYQWVAIATAQGLHRVDGTPFDGFLPAGIRAALDFLSAISPWLPLSPVLAEGANQAATVAQDAQTKAEPQGQALVKKYKLLRDRVAWELATQGATVEFEVVGDDPGNPGLLYTRKIGEDKAPDLSAVFSTMTPREMWKAGLSLEDRFEAANVTFKKLDLSGANPRMGIGAVPILAILITVVVAILAFFWLYHHVMESKKMNSTAVELILKDQKLTDSEKAALVQKLKSSNSFFDEMFGSSFPWTTVIIGATVVGLAYFLLPALLVSFTAKPAYTARGAHA